MTEPTMPPAINAMNVIVSMVMNYLVRAGLYPLFGKCVKLIRLPMMMLLVMFSAQPPNAELFRIVVMMRLSW